MRAIMLAAGTGSRLSNNDRSHLPKSLLKFGGKSLLQRHIEILQSKGIGKLALVVGYRAEDIVEEVNSIGAEEFVDIVINERFLESSMVSLWHARETLKCGDDILFMDADVLYHPDLIGRLAGQKGLDYVPMDKNFEHGDEPVKLCIRDGQIVEFRKIIKTECDEMGEWPGFLRWSAGSASRLAEIISRYVDEGKTDEPYEEAFREILLAPETNINFEDISGLPWIEIDFPEDLIKAHDEILPAIERYVGG